MSYSYPHHEALLSAGGFTWLDGAVAAVTVMLLVLMFIVVMHGAGGGK